MLCRCALCAAAGVLRRIAAYCIDNGRIGGSPSDRRHGAVAYRTRRTALHDTVLIVLLRCMIKPVRARARLRLVGKARSGCSCCCCTARIHPPPQQAGHPSSAARPLAASRIAPHLSLVPRPPSKPTLLSRTHDSQAVARRRETGISSPACRRTARSGLRLPPARSRKHSNSK